MPLALPEITDTSTLADVRTAVGDTVKAMIELRSTPPDKRPDTYEADARAATEHFHFLDDIEKGLTIVERATREAANDARNKGTGGKTMSADLDDERRSIGQQFTQADGYEEWASSGRRGGPFQAEVRNLIGGFTAGAYDTNADLAQQIGQPVMVPGSMQRRRAFIRDLMSVQSTGLRVIPYFRELNQLTNETGAQMTSEGSAKAEVTLLFEGYNAVVEKISAWLPATEEILTDAPTLRGYIDTRLEYMLMIREEDQLLNGTGTSPQITGLDTVAGTQDQTVVASDYPATIGLAISKIENVDGFPTGVVGNPLDYWVAVVTRHATQFDNGFGTGAPGSPDGNITWGLPVVRTRAQASGNAWVGDWKMGSTLFDRQETTIKVGDQHSDYFIRNLLVILAEKRIAVAWHRPNLFVEAAVPTS